MKNTYYLLLMIILFPLLCFSQTTFFKTYGDTSENRDDIGYSILQDVDGNYVIAGETSFYYEYKPPHFYYYGDVYFIKTDEYGDTLWTKTYGETGAVREVAYSMDKCNDSGYIICSYNMSLDNLWLIKTNLEGDSIWTKTYPVGTGYCIKRTNDNGYIITGVGVENEADIYLLKVDSVGNTLWLKTYDHDSFYDEGRYVLQTSDSGFIIVGNTEFPTMNEYNIWLIKTNSKGDTLWTKTYGGDLDDIAHSICETEDGGYFISGDYTLWDGGGASAQAHMWLLRTDANGDTIWTKKIIEGASADHAFSGKQTSDGGFIVSAARVNSIGSDIYIIKLDPQGNIQWSNSFGGTDDEKGYDIAETADMGYVITGYQAKDDYRDKNLSVLKVDSVGQLTAINGYTSAPVRLFKIFQNFPNPFNSSTQISFQLAYSGNVKIVVYNMLGQKIANIFDGKKPAGNYTIRYNAFGLSSGIYLYNIIVNGHSETRKMLYIK